MLSATSMRQATWVSSLRYQLSARRSAGCRSGDIPHCQRHCAAGPQAPGCHPQESNGSFLSRACCSPCREPAARDSSLTGTCRDPGCDRFRVPVSPICAGSSITCVLSVGSWVSRPGDQRVFPVASLLLATVYVQERAEMLVATGYTFLWLRQVHAAA
jgi:hypothetical protein